MDYKKILRSKKSRSLVLSLLSIVPDTTMLKMQYRVKLGRKLNLQNPIRFTEKIQWYKINYRNPVMHICVDKYSVRDYVEKKGLGELLVPLYGHYDKVEDVNWEDMPDSFVIKTQQGGGGLSVVLCLHKTEDKIKEITEKLSVPYKYVKPNRGGREWAYWGNPAGIVVEQLLINPDNPDAGLNDYKFMCYNGKVRYIVADVDRYIGHKRNFYNRQWENLHIGSDCPESDREIPCPENLDRMIEIAEKLSEDFPFVRVDLYNIAGMIYFGELTFYPWSGYVQYTPDEWDFRFGEGFELVKMK